MRHKGDIMKIESHYSDWYEDIRLHDPDRTLHVTVTGSISEIDEIVSVLYTKVKHINERQGGRDEES